MLVGVRLSRKISGSLLMKFSIIYPIMEHYCDPKLIAPVARAADGIGFDSFLVWDHYTLPDGPETLDAWDVLAYAAGVTSHMRLGTVVTPIPFRPPAQLAKQVATVDILSEGRAILGVGVGWHQDEFDGYSQWDPLGVRVKKTMEGLDLILRLWTEDKVDFDGEYYQAKGAVLEPKPVSKPHPPLWFGVLGPKMRRLTARYGDAWIPNPPGGDEYRQMLEEMHQHQSEFGTSPPVVGAIQHDCCNTVDEYLSVFEEYGKAGCENFGLIWAYPQDEMVDRLKWFEREVMPKVS